MGKIDRVRIHEFSFEVPDIGLEQASAGVGNMAYVKGSSLTAHRFAVRIRHPLGWHASIACTISDAGASSTWA